LPPAQYTDDEAHFAPPMGQNAAVTSRILAGTDAPGRRALPAGEFLRPIPLLAVLLLAANDWIFKPTWPSWATGKLSDLAGLLFFPLLATALIDTLLWGLFRLGLPVDFTLRRSKLIASILATGVLFTGLKLSPQFASVYESSMHALGFRAALIPDPSDLLALPALFGAYLIGRREIARLPLGRLELCEERFRRHGSLSGTLLGDLVKCGASPLLVEELAQALTAWLSAGNDSSDEKVRLSAALSRVRNPKR
jgi:hypothetical protein